MNIYGYVVEYKKKDSTIWKSTVNDDMGLCFKTLDAAKDCIKRLKNVFDENHTEFNIIPIYTQNKEVENTTWEMCEFSQIY